MSTTFVIIQNKDRHIFACHSCNQWRSKLHLKSTLKAKQNHRFPEIYRLHNWRKWITLLIQKSHYSVKLILLPMSLFRQIPINITGFTTVLTKISNLCRNYFDNSLSLLFELFLTFRLINLVSNQRFFDSTFPTMQSLVFGGETKSPVFVIVPQFNYVTWYSWTRDVLQ